MLTAIQDFVHDSFSVERDQELDRLEVGDFQVWIERGPRAALAAVIRGAAPLRLRATLSDAIGSVHHDMRARLENFDGDSSPFEAVRPTLEDCLEQEFRRKRKGLSPAFVAACGVLALLLAAWGFTLWRDSRRWARFAAAVRDEPGLMLVERRGGRASILRDPLAAAPGDLAAESGFPGGEPALDVRPFLSLDPPIFERRARQLLMAPDSVTLAYGDGVLTASGEGPADWVASFPARAGALPGVNRVQASGLASGADAALAAAILEAGAIRIAFPIGVSAIPVSETSKVDQLADRMRQALALAGQSGAKVDVSIVGRADELGPHEGNVRLSRLRAEGLKAALQARGLPAAGYATRGELVEPGQERTAALEIRLQEGAP
jgi:OOP family OmpA-OmpF porin